GELRAAGYRVLPVREEMRKNLLARLGRGERILPGIIGYDDTVIPEIENAILAGHHMVFLGERGQAKSRIIRGLTSLLDAYVPILRDAEIPENPFAPITPLGRRLAAERGDDLEIRWLAREERYAEKLATPDVSVADLIGEVDPIKAANLKLSFADERVIHYGIIPKSNRGIFVINELPDLQARIQVALFNILEEGDVQIRGFKLRLPLDILFVFTANPEDYTNRGSIITPLKDRIDSQILTHYPASIDDAMSITAQEAWTKRGDLCEVRVPRLVAEIVEEIGFQSRKSEFGDQNSG